MPSPAAIADALRSCGVTELFHLTHLANLDGIADRGVLPYNACKNIAHRDISLASAQARRDDCWIKVRPGSDGPSSVRHLHDFVPLFINPKNPMTYALRSMARELCF